jgi:dGTPase
MEAADDICYSILDIEDGFRLGHVGYVEVAARLERIVERDPRFKPRKPATASERKEAIAYLRAKAINQLANEVAAAFLEHEPALLDGHLGTPLADIVPSSAPLADITAFTRDTCYRARDVVEIELAGYEVLSALLDDFVPAVLTAAPTLRQRKLLDLLPDPPGPDASPYTRLLRVTDHLSGMTDRYAIATFRKLRGITLART